MGKLEITRQFFYKWRYVIGYTLIAITLMVALILVGLYVPGGLSSDEIQSVIKSNTTNFKDFWSIDVINLPYHLLQHASIALFGVSVFSVKLPSIILAFLSAVGLILLLRKWFKPNIAILASVIAITTSQFMFIAQNGTPDIMFLFWPVWLILIASLVPTLERYRKITISAFFAMAAMSLYTPLSIYILVVIAGAVLIHPHLRYLIKQVSKLEIAFGLICILAVLSPLIIMAIRTPGLLLELAGIPSSWPNNLLNNLALLGQQYLSFANPGGTTFITPFFELGSALLVLLGIYFVFQTRVTAKNYVVIIWTLLLIPVIILNPNSISITFLPLVLLLASGLNGLLAQWYGLFPRNPYARIGGLIPVIILVVVLVSSGVSRYIFSYRYNPSLVYSFSKDLSLLPETKYLIVSDKEKDFYQIVDKYNRKLVLIDNPKGSSFVTTRSAKSDFEGYEIDRIFTNSLSNDADRLYLYKKI